MEFFGGLSIRITTDFLGKLPSKALATDLGSAHGSGCGATGNPERHSPIPQQAGIECARVPQSPVQLASSDR
jgi:hypothetical protein